MEKLLQGEELERKAISLGIDIKGDPITQSTMGRQKRADDSELQRRVIEAERHQRESKLWLIALISSIASLVSAITAIVAVMSK